jgi:aspartate aminotransferase
MKFSQRIQRVQPSMTLAITAKAAEMRAQGIDIIGFGAGEPDFDTPKHIREAGIRAIQENDTHYTPVPGTNALRQAIVDKFKNENGLDYEVNQIVVSCGAKQSFYNLAQVLWEEGDEILIPAPYWVSYPDMVLLADATPVVVATTAENDFKITPKQIDAAVTAKSRAIIINSPSNPTGSGYTRQELKAITDCALKHGLLMISDEIYEKIVFDGFEPICLASMGKEVQENSVIINGASKGFAMTGWRIGYIAASAEIAKAVTKLQGQCTSGASSVSQAAMVEALRGPTTESENMATEFCKRRNYVVDRLNKMPGVSCYNPVGAFYAFPDFSKLYDKNWNGAPLGGSMRFAEFLLTDAKVALVPGIAFGADANQRLSFATSMQNLETGLNRIEEAINSLK